MGGAASESSAANRHRDQLRLTTERAATCPASVRAGRAWLAALVITGCSRNGRRDNLLDENARSFGAGAPSSRATPSVREPGAFQTIPAVSFFAADSSA